MPRSAAYLPDWPRRSAGLHFDLRRRAGHGWTLLGADARNRVVGVEALSRDLEPSLDVAAKPFDRPRAQRCDAVSIEHLFFSRRHVYHHCRRSIRSPLRYGSVIENRRPRRVGSVSAKAKYSSSARGSSMSGIRQSGQQQVMPDVSCSPDVLLARSLAAPDSRIPLRRPPGRRISDS